MRLAPLVLLACLGAGAATAALAAPGNPLSEIIVDIAEDQAPVRDVLRRLEERHGLNYAVSEELLARAGTVTVRFKQVPLDVALESICSAAGLHLEIRGPILVILPRSPTQGPALPRVEEGLPGHVPPGGLPQGPAPGRPMEPPPAPPQDEGMQAVGRVSEIDVPNRRLQLKVDGALRDFYLPDAGGPMAFQASRLERAIASMEKGAMTALLYRRDGARSIVTDLVGGTTPPPRRRPSSAGRRPRPPQPPADGPAPAAPEPAAPAPVVEEPAPAEPAAPRARPDVPLPEGAIAGRFVGREGDVVRVRLKTGEVVDLHVPAPGEDDERRERLLAALDTVALESQFLATYEVVGDRKMLRDTITETPRR